ncbi:hypothetical protein J1605_014078 [Eschrichtius robustus]|uniref:Uncharacterized protein n=1 Tax=Eschrichtius robustus TaxID=9764 RepID=A0AB34GF74_ESCRO|nr:hypothetical protein J1605_014078 [Eschrichtius robustus]
MPPVGRKAPRALTRWPLLRLLLLLWLLLWPVTRARTTQGTPSSSTRPDTSSAPTVPGSPRAPSLHERARALMRDFRLVDGQNHLPLLLKQHFRNKLQEVNLRNFSLGQTSLDKLRDGLVGAQVPEGHS